MNVVVIFGAIGAVSMLASRYFVLRALRERCPDVFFRELGAPTFNQLWSRTFDSAAKRTLQSRFNSFIWKGEFLGVADYSIKLWGAAVVVSDLVVIAALCILVYQRFQ